jgi:hypothetical protein
MKLGQRDKRALGVLGIAAAGALVFWFTSGGGSTPASASSSDNIPAAERRVARLRERASTVAGKQAVLKDVSAELEQREKGIIQAATAAQAQALLLDIVRRSARNQAPPVELGSVEFQQASRLGDYGEVHVAVSLSCHIEELLNLLADLASRPEAIAVDEMRIGAHDPKQKTISVRLGVSGVVPRRLVPDKKGVAAF